MGRLLVAAVLGLYIAHQDFWFWDTADPLLLGFLPAGLWYHALYVLAASALLTVLVKYAWPPNWSARLRRCSGKRIASDSKPLRLPIPRRRAVHRHLRLPARRQKRCAEDYFVAGRSFGQFVFLLSLFGTNMTAFAILGASGHAFANGIVTFGLMASSSALLNPLSILLLGTRIWALGKEYGFLTPVQMFRDRWECGHIGTAIFVLQAGLLVPYIIIGVMGGGTVLATVSGGLVPYWFGAGPGGSGSDELRVLRRHARHCLGQHVADGAVPELRRDRRGRDRLEDGRLRGECNRDAGGRTPGAAADTRTDLAALLPELYVRAALHDGAAAHEYLLPDGAQDGAVPPDGDSLSAVHPGDLAALRVSGGDRQQGHRDPRDPGETGSTRGARRGRRIATGRGADAIARASRLATTS
jgi:hypothetical protein